MDIELPPDFKDFLRLLADKKVEYLLIGGYAVAFHGFPRATADMDIWVKKDSENARRMVEVLREFGFESPELTPSLFLSDDSLIRMGIPPMRIEVSTSISGVSFPECYEARVSVDMEGIPVSIIGLDDLKLNKKAAGRHRDLDDLEHLP
jgi:predicted nucleotidyltransferase